MSEKDDLFESLPERIKAEIRQSGDGAARLAENFNTVGEVLSRRMEVMNLLDEERDVGKVMEALVTGAEFMEQVKGDDELLQLARECSREFDYLRHILTDCGMEKMLVATGVIQNVTTGDFESANDIAWVIAAHSGEALDIIRYWEQELHS